MKSYLDLINSLFGEVLSRSRRLLLPAIVLLAAGPLGVMQGGQSALAQQTVFVGNQGPSGVEINLSAIYGGAGASIVAPTPSQQPGLAPRYGGRPLLIPNLNLKRPSPRLALRKPGAVTTTRSAPITKPAAIRAAIMAPKPVARAPAPPAPARKQPAAPKVAAKQAPAKIARLTPPPPAVTALRVTAPNAPIKRITPPKAPTPKAALPKAPAPEISQPKKAAIKTFAPPPPPLLPPPPAVTPKKTVKAALASVAAPVKAPAKIPARPQAKRRQVAALTPSSDDILQVRFRAGSSALTRDDEDLLKTIADKVAATEARLQLKAYAEGSGNDTSKARRLSLSRALAVRSFLIENGLRSTRIDVRALGIARDSGAPDRVDIVLLER